MSFEHFKKRCVVQFTRRPFLSLYGAIIATGLSVIGLYLLSVGYLPAKVSPMEFVVIGLGASVMAVFVLLVTAVILFLPVFIGIFVMETPWYERKMSVLDAGQTRFKQVFVSVLASITLPVMVVGWKETPSLVFSTVWFLLVLLLFAGVYRNKKVPPIFALVDTSILLCMTVYAVMLVAFASSYDGNTGAYKLLAVLYMGVFMIIAAVEFSPKVLVWAFVFPVLVIELFIGWGLVHQSILGTYTAGKLGIGHVKISGLVLTREGCEAFGMLKKPPLVMEENGGVCRVGPLNVIWGIGAETVVEVPDENASRRVKIPSRFIIAEEKAPTGK